LLNKRSNKKNHNSRYIKKFGHQNPSKKSSLVSMSPHQKFKDVMKGEKTSKIERICVKEW
jgi:hypothetical protein